MSVTEKLGARYSRLARLAPAALAVLPAVVLALTSVPFVVTTWGKITGLVVASGLPFAASQAVRDRGLRIESDLFRMWGGRPTEVMLRWRSAPSRSTVSRRHELIRKHLNITLPDEATEAHDPVEADDAYAIAVDALRERTRDATAFPLLQEENIAYGLRRNALAVRRPAIVICVLTMVAAAMLAWSGLVPLGWRQQIAFAVFALLCGAAWRMLATADAVRRAADKYAHQLFVSLETLEAQNHPVDGDR